MGKKIRVLAIIFAIIGFFASFFITNVLTPIFTDSEPVAFIMFIVVAFVNFVASTVLYGFGELIDKVSSIEKELKAMNNKKPDTIVSTADKQPDSVATADDKTEE